MYVYLYMEPVASGGFFFKLSLLMYMKKFDYNMELKQFLPVSIHFTGRNLFPLLLQALFDTESLWIIHQSNHVEN